LEGEFKDLSAYKGQPLLVVNVATFCGIDFIGEFRKKIFF